MRGVEVAQPAVLHERDPAPCQLELEQVRVVPGAEQDGLSTQLHPLLARGADAIAHLSRLRALVARQHELRGLPAPALGPQPPGKSLAVTGGDGGCDREACARRAI